MRTIWAGSALTVLLAAGAGARDGNTTTLATLPSSAEERG